MFTVFFALDQFFFGFHFATQVTKYAWVCWTCLWSNILLDFMRHFHRRKYVQPMDKNQWYYSLHSNGDNGLYLGFVNTATVSKRDNGWIRQKKLWRNIWSRATLHITIQFVKCSVFVCRHTEIYAQRCGGQFAHKLTHSWLRNRPEVYLWHYCFSVVQSASSGVLVEFNGQMK